MDSEMILEVSDTKFDSPSSYLDTSLPDAFVNEYGDGEPLAGDRQASVIESVQAPVVESADEVFASNLRLLVKPKPSVVPKVIGVQDPELSETSQKSDGTLSESNALTVTLDTTTYTDRAVVTIENGRGFDVYLTALSIHGKRVIRYPDALINDSLKRDDDIRRNGEKVLHVANNYIVNGTQVDKIADFWFKYYQSRKHIYSITIKGTAPWYEVGEWYQLSLGSADSVEYIDATVECYSVQCERMAGGIGTTVCMFREVLEGWTKTTLYTARAILGGSPARRTARSNSVTVASSTFDGVYDYRCDGTADDVQIQAAIDYVASTFGGGTIELPTGIINITAPISLKSNIRILGSGDGTIIKPNGCAAFSFNNIDGAWVQDLRVDFTGGTFTGIAIVISDDASTKENVLQSISITGITCVSGSDNVAIGISSSGSKGTVVRECVIDSIVATTGNTTSIGISGAMGAYNNRLGTFTGYGTGKGVGISNSVVCLNNSVVGASTSKYGAGYFPSYASATGVAGTGCADTAAGGYNS